jgi:2-polyprenyl-3-methyl-5-hydroxy-6-metoxy-1,4-benzoquinol methylase
VELVLSEDVAVAAHRDLPGRSWDSHAHEIAILANLPASTSRILEVGCGEGHLAAEMARRGHHVAGVDLSEEAIGRARSWYPDLRFELGSVFADLSSVCGQVDVVVSVEVIEHLTRPDIFLRNAWETLSPGGTLLLTTPYHGYLKNLLLAVFNRWDRHFTVDWVGGHIKFFSVKTLGEMVEKAGFTVESFQGIGRVPFLRKSILCRALRKV